ncbi:MAG: hypothetical protein JSR85_05145 [Proteobacteria bacterium]|nr:hypothetical protein [Pseudomonadota bacterium]
MILLSFSFAVQAVEEKDNKRTLIKKIAISSDEKVEPKLPSKYTHLPLPAQIMNYRKIYDKAFSKYGGDVEKLKTQPIEGLYSILKNGFALVHDSIAGDIKVPMKGFINEHKKQYSLRLLKNLWMSLNKGFPTGMIDTYDFCQFNYILSDLLSFYKGGENNHFSKNYYDVFDSEIRKKIVPEALKWFSVFDKINLPIVSIIYLSPKPGQKRHLMPRRFVWEFFNPKYEGYLAVFDVLQKEDKKKRSKKDPHWSSVSGTRNFLTHDFTHIIVDGQVCNDKALMKKMRKIFSFYKKYDEKENKRKIIEHGLYILIHESPLTSEKTRTLKSIDKIINAIKLAMIEKVKWRNASKKQELFTNASKHMLVDMERRYREFGRDEEFILNDFFLQKEKWVDLSAREKQHVIQLGYEKFWNCWLDLAKVALSDSLFKMAPKEIKKQKREEETELNVLRNLISQQNYSKAFSAIANTENLASDSEIVKFLLTSNGYKNWDQLSYDGKIWIIGTITNKADDEYLREFLSKQDYIGAYISLSSQISASNEEIIKFLLESNGYKRWKRLGFSKRKWIYDKITGEAELRYSREFLSAQDYSSAFQSIRNDKKNTASNEEIVKFLLESNGFVRWNRLNARQRESVVEQITNAVYLREIRKLLSTQDYSSAFQSIRSNKKNAASDKEIVKFLLESNGYKNWDNLSYRNQNIIKNSIKKFNCLYALQVFNDLDLWKTYRDMKIQKASVSDTEIVKHALEKMGYKDWDRLGENARNDFVSFMKGSIKLDFPKEEYFSIVEDGLETSFPRI